MKMTSKNMIILVSLIAMAQAPAKEGIIQCANLIYAGTQTSRCFSDEFLSVVQRKTTIATERRFKSVKLDSDELFSYPFVMITGEKDFTFSRKERENLQKYLTSGGFLLASSGCSAQEWGRAFQREMKTILEDAELSDIAMDHPIFKTVNKIESITLAHEGQATLQGIEVDNKIVTVFSPHGLNDTANTEGCCCCGGNEIANSLELIVNIFVYSLLY